VLSVSRVIDLFFKSRYTPGYSVGNALACPLGVNTVHCAGVQRLRCRMQLLPIYGTVGGEAVLKALLSHVIIVVKFMFLSGKWLRHVLPLLG